MKHRIKALAALAAALLLAIALTVPALANTEKQPLYQKNQITTGRTAKPRNLGTKPMVAAEVGIFYEEFISRITSKDSVSIFLTSGALPQGLSLFQNTDGNEVEFGIQGTPTAEGDFRFSYTIRSNKGEIAYGKCSITVVPDHMPMEPPEIVIVDLPEGTVGEAYSAYVQAKGAPEIYIGEYYNPGGPNDMPDGLRFSSSGSGEIKGTPEKAGTFSFFAYAANDIGEDYAKFTLTIAEAKAPAAPELPVITTKALPNGVVGEAYSVYVRASGTPEIYIDQYYNPGGPNNMPFGLRFSSSGSGRLSGTPTKAGDYTFFVYAANDAGEDHAEFTVTIEDAPDTVAAPETEEIEPPQITTRALPKGRVGEPYLASLTANGTPKIEFGQYYNPGGPNDFPAGLRLSSSGSGRISGTPTQAGTYTFYVYAANQAGEDYKKLTLTIEEARPGKTPRPIAAPLEEKLPIRPGR